MRLVRSRTDSDVVTFQLSRTERDLLVEMLHKYPLVPATHFRISNDAHKQRAEWQQLLDEAVAEQRNANRRKIAEWLAEPNRFEKVSSGWRFSLRREQSEWLLQVMNDVRVGCWLELGSPEQPVDPKRIDSSMLRAWVTMEVSGWFEMALLTQSAPPPPG